MNGRLVGVLAAALVLLTLVSFAISAHDRGERPRWRRGAAYDVSGLAPTDPAQGRRLTTAARRVGVPAPALRAYARAQVRAPAGCHLGWATLAGIGYVESAHGTLGGRRLQPDGRSSSPVIGPALDGRGPVARIRSTAASQSLHGDAVWEHAVGPMQFLPGTWARWRADGDRDGRSDPLDLDDAALAAARYLCADGRDVGTGHGWEDAVLSYNHSEAYVRDVFDAARGYAAALHGPAGR